MSSRKPIVVIGAGNLMRGDDAVGRLALRSLATKQLQEIDLIEIEGEATQVLEALGGAAGAIVIDACKSGASVGTIHRFDVSSSPLPVNMQNLSSHGFGLAVGLELARTLEQLPATCVVFAIEIEDIAFGSPSSKHVNDSFDELLYCVEQEIKRIQLART